MAQFSDNTICMTEISYNIIFTIVGECLNLVTLDDVTGANLLWRCSLTAQKFYEGFPMQLVFGIVD